MLTLVPTPIGNLKDITYRAVEALNAVDVIACEDTRVTGKLLKHYDIRTNAIAYHEHNAEQKRPELLAMLAAGHSIALVSDAGTPLVSDPGYKLVAAAIKADITVTPLPGPSAVLTALCASGLPPQPFTFLGFLPGKQEALATLLTPFESAPTTLIAFESPNRLVASLTRLADRLGDRQAAVGRELTKLFEENKRGSLSALATYYQAHPPKGEIVITIAPPQQGDAPTDDAQIERVLTELLNYVSARDAAALASSLLNINKKKAYALATALKNSITFF